MAVPAETKRRCSPIQVGHLLACLACLLGLLAPSYAVAEDPVFDDWQFQIAPYAWALAADGDVTVKGQKSDVNLSFKDIWEELNYGAMLEGEARKGRVGVIANILYANLGDEENVGGIKIDPDINLFWGSFAGYYRLSPWNLDSEAGADGPQLIIDPYAGVRYTYLDIDLDIGGGPTWATIRIGSTQSWACERSGNSLPDGA
jgi:hypothetical protein